MKKILLSLAFVGVLAAASCSREPLFQEEHPFAETGNLSVNIVLDGDGLTRAAYTAETDSEKKLSDIQLLIFHADGKLAYYRDLGTSQSIDDICLTCGDKTVWVVANAPDLSSVGSLSELTAKSIELAENNDPDSDFVMAGHNSVTVGKDSSVGIVMTRFVSRIVLNRVTNGLPSAAGKLAVENVYLSNVVGNQTLAGGSDKPSLWYNQMGRQTDAVLSTAIIDGKTYMASAPKLTFRTVGASVNTNASLSGGPYLLYTYPNDATADVPGWSSGFTARKTCLVVTATLGGKRYYYPVAVGPTVRNNTYTVEMNITGPGSEDPGKPVDKDSFKATITTQSWQGTTVYTETI